MYAKNTKKVKVETELLKTYVAYARASVGSTIFRKYFAKINGSSMEVLRAGKLSCAFHITAILKVFSLVREVQITVHRAMDEMMRSGWRPAKKIKPGAIIIWAEKPADPKRMRRDKKHYAGLVRHVGIYIGRGKAVHNDGDKKRAPILSKWNYRPVEKIWWNKRLG